MLLSSSSENHHQYPPPPATTSPPNAFSSSSEINAAAAAAHASVSVSVSVSFLLRRKSLASPLAIGISNTVMLILPSLDSSTSTWIRSGFNVQEHKASLY
uniref:Uncharacterized protein n=1 Tax=Oryza meridionalis TaxID=40149 RepID=A0A0E0DNF7_9ORYZ